MSVYRDSRVQRAYRALIDRIADLEPDSGWPANTDLMKAARPLAREEQAVICAYNPQAMVDEFSIDPAILGAYLRRDIGTLDLAEHVEECTHKAAWEAIHSDVMDECSNRAELAEAHRMEQNYVGSTPQTDRERLMSAHSHRERDFR